jgi:hypothetical protein
MTFTNIAQQCNSDWIGKQVKQYLYQSIVKRLHDADIYSHIKRPFTFIAVHLHVNKILLIVRHTNAYQKLVILIIY